METTVFLAISRSTVRSVCWTEGAWKFLSKKGMPSAAVLVGLGGNVLGEEGEFVGVEREAGGPERRRIAGEAWGGMGCRRGKGKRVGTVEIGDVVGDGVVAERAVLGSQVLAQVICVGNIKAKLEVMFAVGP